MRFFVAMFFVMAVMVGSMEALRISFDVNAVHHHLHAIPLNIRSHSASMLSVGHSFRSLATPDEACTNAVQSYLNNFKNVCSAMSSMASGSTSPASVINIMCGNAFDQCKDAISGPSAVNALRNACSQNQNEINQMVSQMAEGFSKVDGMRAAMCVKDDVGNNCLGSLLASNPFGNGTFSIDSLNDSVLNTLCNPCIKTVINKMSALPDLDNGMGSAMEGLSKIQLLCNKDPTDPSQYCMKKIIAMKVLSEKIQAGSIKPDDATFSTFCSPCIAAFISQLNAAGDTIDSSFLETFGKVCKKDFKNGGRFCGALFFNQSATLSNAFSSCTSSSLCSSECSAAVSLYYGQSESCCYSTFGMNDLVKFFNNSFADKSFGLTAKLSNAAKCNVAASNQCAAPPTTPITLIIALRNINPTITGNATIVALVSAALKKDLSIAFGVDISAISLGAFTAAPRGGLLVVVNVVIDSSFANDYKKSMNDKLSNNGGIPLYNTVPVVLSNNAKLNAADPVDASDPNATSNAVHHTISIAAVAFMIVAAFHRNF